MKTEPEMDSPDTVNGIGSFAKVAALFRNHDDYPHFECDQPTLMGLSDAALYTGALLARNRTRFGITDAVAARAQDTPRGLLDRVTPYLNLKPGPDSDDQRWRRSLETGDPLFVQGGSPVTKVSGKIGILARRFRNREH